MKSSPALNRLTTLMNVTSGLAFVPFTKVPVYSATKAFFHSFLAFLFGGFQPRRACPALREYAVASTNLSGRSSGQTKVHEAYIPLRFPKRTLRKLDIITVSENQTDRFRVFYAMRWPDLGIINTSSYTYFLPAWI